MANHQNIITAENVVTDIILSGKDPAGNQLTYTIVTQPPNGTLLGTMPKLTYTPTMGFFGQDSFTFQINNGVSTATAVIKIHIQQVIGATPIASDGSTITQEDMTVNGFLKAVDPDNETLTYAVVTDPAVTEGTVTMVNTGTGEYRFTPALNFNGIASFTFTATDVHAPDAAATSNVATVSVSVQPANDLPVANPLSFTFAEDTTQAITLAGSDPDLDPINFIVVSPPSSGILTGIGQALSYSPRANYHGSDSFTYKVNDGAVDSAVVTILLNITSANDAPVALGGIITTREDTPASGIMKATDVDNEALTYAIVKQPAAAQGSVSFNAATGEFLFIPAPNFFGAAQFTYTATDAGVPTPVKMSNVGTVIINVQTVNDKPTASSLSVTLAEDTQATVTLAGTDTEPGTLNYLLVSTPTNGMLTGTGSALTYSPNANYFGSDSFTYKVNDGLADSAVATVLLNISAANDAPVAVDGSATIQEETPFSGALNAGDADHDPLTYAVVTAPAATEGSVTLNASTGDFLFIPASNFNGVVQFTFKATDAATAASNVATFTITVQAINDIPVATPLSITLSEDTPATAKLLGTDTENSPLTYLIVATPANGTLSGTGNTLTYMPNANYVGTDSFTYKVNDGAADSALASVLLSVIAVNDAPVAVNGNAASLEDTAVSGALSASDVDDATLTYAVLAGPAVGEGILTLNTATGDFLFVPASNFNGLVQFTFKASDAATAVSNVATFSITVQATNDIPVASFLTITLTEDTPVTVKLLGADTENSPLTYLIVGTPNNGTLSGTGNTLTYTSNPNYYGLDSFTYKVNDGTADSALATVLLSVTAVNDVPVAVNGNATTQEDTAVSGALSASDVDDATLTYAVVAGPAASEGILTLNAATGTFLFVPASNFNGVVNFTFKATDTTTAVSNVATFTMTVQSVNDAPVAQAQNVLAFNEDNAKTITLVGTDTEAGLLTFRIISQPFHGVLTLDPAQGNSGNVFIYTPKADFYGQDSFVFKVNDGASDSASATVLLNITAANDAPVASGASFTTFEITPVFGALTASDVDNEPLTYAVATSTPADGTLTITNTTTGEFMFNPATNFTGVSTFTFTASDAASTVSNAATVSIVVKALNPGQNDAPIATPTNVTLNEDTATAIPLFGSDPENAPITYQLVAAPSNGVLTGTPIADGTGLTYTPAPDFHGQDSFTYKVNDGLLDSTTATVVLSITSVNDAPTATDLILTVQPKTPVIVNLKGTDVDGDTLRYTVTGLPTITGLTTVGGYLAGITADLPAPSAISFSPPASLVDDITSTFTYTVTDGVATSAKATVTLIVVGYGNSHNDTDGDGLLDIDEINTHNTSPELADSDGDGFSDAEEVAKFNNNAQGRYVFNPLIADIPDMQVNLVSAPDISIEMTALDGTVKTIANSVATGTSSTVASIDETSDSVSQEEAKETGGSVSVLLGNESKVGLFTSGSTFKVEVTATANYSQAWTSGSESVSTHSVERSDENSQMVEQTDEFSNSHEVTQSGGFVHVAAKVINTGHLSFTLSNLFLSSYYLDKSQDNPFVILGNLRFDTSGLETFPAFTLAPTQSTGPIRFITDTIDLQTTLDALSFSNSLVVKPSVWEMLDAAGNPYTQTFTNIAAQSALIIVDYGPASGKRRLKKHVSVMNVPGNGGGRSLKSILVDTLGLSVTEKVVDPTLAPDSTNLTLDSIDGLVNGSGANIEGLPQQTWMVLHGQAQLDGTITTEFYASSESYTYRQQKQFSLTSVQLITAPDLFSLANVTDGQNLSQAFVRPGDIVHISYVADSDKDGIFDRGEKLLGSDGLLTDTDGDGISDAIEMIGWNITTNNAAGSNPKAIRVTSNPRLQDSDGDGLWDGEEAGYPLLTTQANAGERVVDSTQVAIVGNMSDARSVDTDGDFIPDNLDANNQLVTSVDFDSFATSSDSIGNVFLHYTWTDPGLGAKSGALAGVLIYRQFLQTGDFSELDTPLLTLAVGEVVPQQLLCANGTYCWSLVSSQGLPVNGGVQGVGQTSGVISDANVFTAQPADSQVRYLAYIAVGDGQTTRVLSKSSHTINGFIGGLDTITFVVTNVTYEYKTFAIDRFYDVSTTINNFKANISGARDRSNNVSATSTVETHDQGYVVGSPANPTSLTSTRSINDQSIFDSKDGITPLQITFDAARIDGNCVGIEMTTAESSSAWVLEATTETLPNPLVLDTPAQIQQYQAGFPLRVGKSSIVLCYEAVTDHWVIDKNPKDDITFSPAMPAATGSYTPANATYIAAQTALQTQVNVAYKSSPLFYTLGVYDTPTHGLQALVNINRTPTDLYNFGSLYNVNKAGIGKKTVSTNNIHGVLTVIRK